MTKEYTYEEALAIQNKRKAYRKQYYDAHKEQILDYHRSTQRSTRRRLRSTGKTSMPSTRKRFWNITTSTDRPILRR
jgi:hypothetical protein